MLSISSYVMPSAHHIYYHLYFLGVNNDQFDLFLWEVFTTKPHYNQRELTYLGEFHYNMRFSLNITDNSVN